METKIVAILCEGPHDVAFITKILKTQGYISNEKLKINSFPSPINDLFVNEVKKSNVEDLNLQEVRQALLPSCTLQKNNIYLFLYSLGGDGKIAPRQRLLSDFVTFIPKEGRINSLSKDTQLSILYFFDADKDGLSDRIFKLNNEIEAVLGEKPFETHKEIKFYRELKLGSFIFTGLDNNTGKLEDILLPLMKKGNELIFDNAKKYLEELQDDSRLFPLKLKVDGENNTTEYRSEKSKEKLEYDEQKSLIGVVGQLQKSGGSNVVCISQTDYLTKSKIDLDLKCIEIFDYFKNFIS